LAKALAVAASLVVALGVPPHRAVAGVTAENPTELGVVRRVFTTTPLDSSLFAPSWTQIPFIFYAVASVVKAQRSRYGDFKSAERVSDHVYKVTLARGVCYARLELDRNGLIETLAVHDSPDFRS
jgi:hypothetical protein